MRLISYRGIAEKYGYSLSYVRKISCLVPDFPDPECMQKAKCMFSLCAVNRFMDKHIQEKAKTNKPRLLREAEDVKLVCLHDIAKQYGYKSYRSVERLRHNRKDFPKPVTFAKSDGEQFGRLWFNGFDIDKFIKANGLGNCKKTTPVAHIASDGITANHTSTKFDDSALLMRQFITRR